MSLEQSLKRAYARPTNGLSELDRVDAEESLSDFIRLAWPVLEPGRDLVLGKPLDAICEHLEAVTAGEIRRLLINVPPGMMKSLSVRVFWPVWEWLAHPDRRYIGASYADALALRDNRRARLIVTSDWFQNIWGDTVQMSTDQAAKGRFENTARGWMQATSVRGIGTGERGDRFIIDDPHNIKDVESELERQSALQWFSEVVPSRLNDASKSAIVVIMQRAHEQDISGHILEHDLGYEHLMLPMEFEPDRKCSTSIGFTDWRTEDGELLWPERFSHDDVEELKTVLRSWGGTYAEAGQLQQRPAPRGGGMFQKDDFQIVDNAPTKARRVRGWDLAATADGGAYTVGVKIAIDDDDRVCIEDVVRGQWGPAEVENNIRATAELDGHDVEQDIPQDPGQAGKAQKAALAKKLHGFVCHFSPETGAKEDRARPLAAQSEGGNLFVVRAPWNNAFIAEAATFPAGKFKDQVDASSRAYARLIQTRPESIGVAPVLFE